MKRSWFLVVILGLWSLSTILVNASAASIGPLRVSQITFSPTEVSPGQNVTVTIGVKNTSANQPVPMYNVGIRVKSATSSLTSISPGDTLAPGQSRSYSLNFTFPQVQTSSVIFEVNATGMGGDTYDIVECRFRAKYIYEGSGISEGLIKIVPKRPERIPR